MTELVEAVLALVAQVSPSQVEVFAERLQRDNVVREQAVEGFFGTPSARAKAKNVFDVWTASNASADYIAGLLLGAASARRKAKSETSIELVWTGPTTQYVATRRTEQVLLDLIRRAEREIIIVSFVAYKVPGVVEQLKEALHRGVKVRFLLESAESEGGSLTVDPPRVVREAIPGAEIYAWKEKPAEYHGGKVHAKIAVADAQVAFMGSANLTNHALEKNMEAGILITGGEIPVAVDSHLKALIGTGVLALL